MSICTSHATCAAALCSLFDWDPKKCLGQAWTVLAAVRRRCSNLLSMMSAADFVWGTKLSALVCRISSLVSYVKAQSPSSKIVLVGGSSQYCLLQPAHVSTFHAAPELMLCPLPEHWLFPLNWSTLHSLFSLPGCSVLNTRVACQPVRSRAPEHLALVGFAQHILSPLTHCVQVSCPAEIRGPQTLPPGTGQACKLHQKL